MKSEKNKASVISSRKHCGDVTCLQCGSSRLYKNGFSPERKQVYKCKDCGKLFIAPALRKLPPVYPPNLICPSCGSGKIKRKGKRKETQDYKCLVCGRTFCQYPYAGAGTHLPVSDDVWDIKDFGLQDNLCKSSSKLVFYHIHQDWLKAVAKRFIRYSITNKSPRTLRGYMTYFNCLSEFLKKQYPGSQSTDINREIIISYLEWLKKKQVSAGSQNHRIGFLKLFFTTVRREDWLSIHPDLICSEDSVKKSQRLPRYIPDYVIKQINKQLDTLPHPVMRMILVIQECGLRVSELLLLRINCLERDSSGRYFIQFMRWKMKKETRLPISSELASIIKEQQEYINQYFGKSFDYLFCGREPGKGKFCSPAESFIPVPKVMQYATFARYLKRLVERGDIRDELGKIWDLESHQFRHTVGTSMVNRGVPLTIIQKYLGHESPTMTMNYAHIYDETLRKEIEKYHESRVVNFQGETVELEDTILSSSDDLEWFKKNVQARALEHGYCARPKVLGDCDIPGFDGCYSCPHWRTNKNFIPILKDTLERTNNVLIKAQSCGWDLQVHKNTPIKENLEKVIKTLEADNEIA